MNSATSQHSAFNYIGDVQH